MKNLLFITLFILSSCVSKNTSESDSTTAAGSTKNIPAFNNNEELYIVYKIGNDTLDPNGNRCKMVEMKSASAKYFTSCMSDQLPAIGDSIWIGYDKSGMPYIVSLKKNNQR